ncbi:MAG: DUF5695 domain-containing protein [Terriglobales bacterium]
MSRTSFSRREMLRATGLTGAALLAGSHAAAQSPSTPQKGESAPATPPWALPSRELLAEMERHLARVRSGPMQIAFDMRYGALHAITRAGDPFQTNYIGNAINTPGVNPADSRWTGDVVTTVWHLLKKWDFYDYAPGQSWGPSGLWRSEVTGLSHDVRRVRLHGEELEAVYRGKARNPGGLRSSNITVRFTPAAGGSLLWTLEITNTTSQLLEAGELGVPLMINDDYAELYMDPGTGQVKDDLRRTPVMQKLIHEQKVLSHPFIGGHSSYVLIQRPLGDAPFLLLHTVEDTALECRYKRSGGFVRYGGPDILALYSRAIRDLRRWQKNPWFNGHRSLLLQPGETRRFQLRFVFVDGYDAMRAELANAGLLAIRIVPAMVLAEGQEAHVEIRSQQPLTRIEKLSDNISIRRRVRQGDQTLLTLAFRYRGQKTLRLHYGQDRWTTLAFYNIGKLASLLKARGRFVVAREFYRNPKDPFHRYHGFLPFDQRIGSRFDDSVDVWAVGCSDEAGFSEPLFLAQKNMFYPVRREIATLETYVTDCLFKYIQNPQTYAVRASLYWKVRTPSSGWGDWSEKRSEATFRTYNYVHPANIYYSLYRVGKLYGLLRQRPALEYLRMSYRTCMKWFTTGPYRHVGLMEGSNSIHILAALQAEGMSAEYANLRAQMQSCEDTFVRLPYPYGSELLIDQTAHEQVYFFTRFFGATAKNRKTIQVMKALRGGDQPVWFRYGNDRRGDIAGWYSEALVGMSLMQAFEDTGDREALLKGYAGLQSVMANVLPDGMGYNFFICTPGIYDHTPPRTYESGPGLWGYMQGAAAYVLEDPAFGWVGYGCGVQTTPAGLDIRPNDGLRKRVYFADTRVHIRADRGEIHRVVRGPAGALELRMGDSTGLVKDVLVRITGLAPGRYRLRAPGHGRRLEAGADGAVSFELPLAAARRFQFLRMA